MRHRKILALILSLSLFLPLVGSAQNKEKTALREISKQELSSGLYKEAFAGFKKLLEDPQNTGREILTDLDDATNCLNQLGDDDEFDKFINGILSKHKQNWRLNWAAARAYLRVPRYGYIIGGVLSRGYGRDGYSGGAGGKQVYLYERDRAIILQLMLKAEEGVDSSDAAEERAEFYFDFARMLLGQDYAQQAWRLQEITDLSQIPEPSADGNDYAGYQASYAPTQADGTPVYYYLPQNFAEAKNDGERWRLMLFRAGEQGPKFKAEAALTYASFLRSQFGVETLSSYRHFFTAPDDTGDTQQAQAMYSLSSLSEDETIAKLASGIKRFSLPTEFNFIKIYQSIAEETSSELSSPAEQALQALAEIFENRRQYPQAAKYWQESIKRFGNSNSDKALRLAQIVNPWGEFEPTEFKASGGKSQLRYRFRNGSLVRMQAEEIDVPKLLEDVKEYLKSNPKNTEWGKLEISHLGYRLITNNEPQYIEKKVADWEVSLSSRPKHFDRTILIDTPLSKPGAYLLTAQMKDGNTSKVVLWVNDTVIVRKPLEDGLFYFVADANTGKPIKNSTLQLFGYRQESERDKGFRYNTKIVTDEFKQSSDSGQFEFSASKINSQSQWMALATDSKGRFAYHGFNSIWYQNRSRYSEQREKVFFISNQPVYRPGQVVKFKAWIAKADYEKASVSRFSGQNVELKIFDPKGEIILKQDFLVGSDGGFDGEFALNKEATLGVYRLSIPEVGRSGEGGTFRVEEYKKPEFEVKIDSPSEPIVLGQKANVKINAKYYFGAPVTEAKVRYKVLRSSYSSNWYPVGDWDWLYGPGYWWFAYDYEWFPGWTVWGCRRPVPPWWGGYTAPPEVVLDGEMVIGKDGSSSLVIDTAFAKEMHGKSDHRYQITAEVVDSSRRTIVGRGEFIAAREPFKVFAWTDKGYYLPGSAVQASFFVRTVDGNPVSGKGELSLYQITYDAEKAPKERVVETWPLDANDDGRATMQFKASSSGQYRLSYKIKNNKEQSAEGGYVFTVNAPGDSSSNFRFSEIELVPDKREYAPGEKVRLLLNTDQAGSTVILFLRPQNGIYGSPEILSISGKSKQYEIEVSKADMPNFFVEALTIHNGQVYSEIREIVVPPEKRILNVEVTTPVANYKPGATGKLEVRVTELDGRPYQGLLTLAGYDKALEYISAGSNVPDIKSFFWKWRRQHTPSRMDSTQVNGFPVIPPGAIGMNSLGIFGQINENEDGSFQTASIPKGAGGLVRKGRAGSGPEGSFSASRSVEAFSAPQGKMEMVADVASDVAAELETVNLVEPAVRSFFADSLLWETAVKADAAGLAQVELKFPENLSTWKLKAWAMGVGAKVGQGETEVLTTKELLLRLQAPRFFVEKDEVVLSANVHNYLPLAKDVQVELELLGDTLSSSDSSPRKVHIASGSEARVDWRVLVKREGTAQIRMKALTDQESDAMEMKFPVYVHGMEKMDSVSGAISPNKSSASFEFKIPKDRRPEQSVLEVRYSPSLAAAMVDALPYLAAYPYGCTEQTLNRFLPTVITQKILQGMNLDLAQIKEKRTNLNAQELGDAGERSKQWQRFESNPVFDREELAAMVKAGLNRLESMQMSDGGWGWFSGIGEYSDAHTTSIVLHGLQVAHDLGLEFNKNIRTRGLAWLKSWQDTEISKLENAKTKVNPWKERADELDAFVQMVLTDAGSSNQTMREFLFRDYVGLSLYGKTLFALTLVADKQDKQLVKVKQAIEQFLVKDAENQTAYLRMGANNRWWYWYGSEIETLSYYLKLLTKTDPKGEVAPGVVKYLLNNRKHSRYWESTRDTALAIEALADYLKASGEMAPEMTLQVYWDGQKQKEVKINKENLFTFDGTFRLAGEELVTGLHKVELRKQGSGPVYYNAYIKNFTLEDFITKAGLEVKVDRIVYKLEPKDSQVSAVGDRGNVVKQKIEDYHKVPLANLSKLKSGELIEVELIVESKNDYEYLIFEDMKAAGFEPMEVRSGYTANGLGAYVEYRDDRVSFFIRRLSRGKHSLSYRMRAEIPGKFSALPTKASAMYAPELRGNSDEIKLFVED